MLNSIRIDKDHSWEDQMLAMKPLLIAILLSAGTTLTFVVHGLSPIEWAIGRRRRNPSH